VDKNHEITFLNLKFSKKLSHRRKLHRPQRLSRCPGPEVSDMSCGW